jgi:hypothetical protein
VETATLIAGKDAIVIDDLNDSSRGSASAMAGNQGGGDQLLGEALRVMARTAPATGTNTIIVTHKTNITDAFGAEWAEVAEGEATIFRPDGSDQLVPIARIPAAEWTAAGLRPLGGWMCIDPRRPGCAPTSARSTAAATSTATASTWTA